MEAAITTSVLEEYLPRIARAFEARGFVPAGELADRHGALQLTFLKESKDLARLILLNEAIGTGEEDYRGTIDVLVQVGDRFVRRRAIATNSREEFERDINGDAIDRAAALVESLTANDLSESFKLRRDSDEPLQDLEFLSREDMEPDPVAQKTLRRELEQR